MYYISRCSVKPANKKFSQIPHDFELTLINDTQVIPCNDTDASIPQLQINFTPLSALKDLAPDSFVGLYLFSIYLFIYLCIVSSVRITYAVDVIGVCKHVNDVQNLVARSSKRELKKRDITLVDQTDASVSVE